MLSQRVFNASSLLFFLFFFSVRCSVWMFSIALPASLLVCASISSVLLSYPSTVFFSPVMTSVWYFLIFSISLLKFFLCPSSSSPKISEHFYDHYFESFITQVAYFQFIKIFFWGCVMYFGLEHIPLSPHFACFSVYTIRQNGYPLLAFKEWSCAEAVPCGPEVQSPLVTRASHCVGIPMCCMVGLRMLIQLT